MAFRRGIMQALTRAHLWLGEAIGLTYYRNCHSCTHCHKYGDCGPETVGCDIYQKDVDMPDDFLAVTDPSEAVWCYEFENKFVL